MSTGWSCGAKAHSQPFFVRTPFDNLFFDMTTLIYARFGTSGAAVFGLIRQVPYLLLSPVAGYLIDRFPRKSLFLLIYVLNLVSMVTLLILTVMKLDHLIVYLSVALIQVFVGTVDYPIRSMKPQMGNLPAGVVADKE
jgi:MFS family permease